MSVQLFVDQEIGVWIEIKSAILYLVLTDICN